MFDSRWNSYPNPAGITGPDPAGTGHGMAPESRLWGRVRQGPDLGGYHEHTDYTDNLGPSWSLDVLDNRVVPRETGHLNDGRVPQLADEQNDLKPDPEADDPVGNAVSPIMPTHVNVNPTAVEVYELLQGPQVLANVIRLIIARKGKAYMKLPNMDSYVKMHFANGGVINNTPLHLIRAHVLAKPAKWRDTNLPRGVISNGTLSTEHAQGLNQFLCTMVKHKRTTLRNISRAQVTSQWETIDRHLEMLAALSPVELQARINLYMRMDAKF
ncbi:hypothetical protein PtA15_15A151 [Puccinia triticina]|uniref:Uncharacterized protein n=1 Tax=Puccinia triticina TaxID=208348 RepID=A0ABY7D2D2_9BASI|nr:uncharacterized protein PtA15_15A151 [Puccinia triticina]WAQ91759.1 hypothetical protein PtA15_15A151 [Puccinia triticina]